MTMHSRPSSGTGPAAQSSSLIRRQSAFQSHLGTLNGAFATSAFDSLLADFTARSERGEKPNIQEYFERLDSGRPAERVELIYREFCLAEVAGLSPRIDDYLTRFPADAPGLRRVFDVHNALGTSIFRHWAEPPTTPLPDVGDEIGPYRFIRELGRGGFARVFLAEQTDLDDRLVVVKVASRITPEPALLARSSHPNIVEVLWNGSLDDGSLQIICMPFQGGASLSAILAERRRRANRPRSGRDLLADLDRVSAEGYLPASSGRPAREMIERLSYPRATAWVVARLAEALDFAYSRGVLHGDVKPSNVLLTADGTPKLLDFNLSVGCRPPWNGFGSKELPGDTGGTLAYMAPERLRSVADTSDSPSPSMGDRHRADIYSLGVLLLEMLTGRAPELPKESQLSLRELASYYVSSRSCGGDVMIRSARSVLPAGLSSVIRRCLAHDPSDRYKCASELATDLDLWRTNLPLAFAPNLSPGFGLVRWARRQRVALTVFFVGLTVAVAASTFAWMHSENLRRRSATSRYSLIVDNEDSGAFPGRRRRSSKAVSPGNLAEVSRQFLDRYGVLDHAGDWRKHDEFRGLPASERDDLEAFLLEHVLRYAHALGQRPDSPEDWQRALNSLEQVVASSPSRALLNECRELRQLLNLAESSTRLPTPVAHGWTDEYLLGVEAELRGDPRDALVRYKTVLASQPSSFWANYRAAACAIHQKCAAFDDAVKYLRACVDQHPDNPVLRRYLASGLYWAGNFTEAAEQCDKAQSLAPDKADTYLTRSMLALKLGQFQAFSRSMNHYDVITGRRERDSSEPRPLDLASLAAGVSNDPAILESGRRSTSAFDPDEAQLRSGFAKFLVAAKRVDLALEQYDRALEAAPDALEVLYSRSNLRSWLQQPGADDDAIFVVDHPHIETFIRNANRGLDSFYSATVALVKRGKFLEAMQRARRAVLLAADDKYGKVDKVRCEYLLAQVYANAAISDPSYNRKAIDSLSRAYQLDPKYVRIKYEENPDFDGLRAEYGLAVFEAR